MKPHPLSDETPSLDQPSFPDLTGVALTADLHTNNISIVDRHAEPIEQLKGRTTTLEGDHEKVIEVLAQLHEDRDQLFQALAQEQALTQSLNYRHQVLRYDYATLAEVTEKMDRNFTLLVKITFGLFSGLTALLVVGAAYILPRIG